MGLEVWLVQSESEVIFEVVDISTGIPFPFGQVGTITGPFDWVIPTQATAVEIDIEDIGGNAGLYVNFDLPVFVQQVVMRIPAWSECVRGANGEWLMGQQVSIPTYGA